MLPHCECSDAVETDICFVSHTATYIRDDPKFIFFHILTAHCATLLMTDSQNGSSKPTKPKAKSWICTWIQILAKGSIFTFSFIPTENDVSPSPWLLPDLPFIMNQHTWLDIIHSWYNYMGTLCAPLFVYFMFLANNYWSARHLR